MSMESLFIGFFLSVLFVNYVEFFIAQPLILP